MPWVGNSIMELDKRFNFKEIDDKWAKQWVSDNAFASKANKGKKPYTIVIPPPNVTGILHMGHALNNTLQDIIIRYKRMKGFETLWMPGTDHAGIATQNVLEKKLAKEGIKRQDLGREKFIEQLWDWKKEYGDTIIHQLEKLGSSCDWERTRFTMDDQYSQAVTQTFVRLHKKGLIYQGKYIINWCPRCQTALSDEEAEHEEREGALYHINYPLKDSDQFITVATTRPETMLGDTAVAVNPQDARYKDLIGQTLILPIVNREIKIIADDFVNLEFGTGAVKVTPAHDPNDFAMGERHKLEFINIMHPDGRLNESAGDFNGLDRFEAREAIIEMLKKLKVMGKIDPHTHSVGHCYRCHTVVEPYLSKQWFVKMQPLATPALQVVLDKKIKFHPARWEKVYIHWMENIRDWCISRQIWWGHRIPVWYCMGDTPCTEPIVSETTPAKCPHCNSTNIKQDEDVLDTWFSSWLWPFATLNWPKDNEDLKYFYPTSSLFTASEIIFFWVARMVMAGLEFMDEIPFTDVYIHGTVRDNKGRKMSKSLGNALDPLEIIDEYGADALRFSLIINSGQDLYISKDKFEIGRNFANKIWNASRLILMKADSIDKNFDLSAVLNNDTNLASQWIVSKYFSTMKQVGKAIEEYNYSEAESLIYDFFWKNFCDWYLEIIKDQWDNPTSANVAYKILELSLIMISPFMPFVTEEIWSQINKEKGSLSHQSWPNSQKDLINAEVEKQMDCICAIISSIRNIRSQWNINPKEKMDCQLSSSNKSEFQVLESCQSMIESLAGTNKITLTAKNGHTSNSACAVINTVDVTIPLGNLIDIPKEKERLTKLITEQKKAGTNLSKRLNNESFVNKAPDEVVEKEKERLKTIEQKIQKLEEVFANFS